MSSQEIQSQIKGFIIEQFLPDSEAGGPANDLPLLDAGILDSTGILELVGFLEEAFEITIEDEELIPTNLDSISNMVCFIGRKVGGS